MRRHCVIFARRPQLGIGKRRLAKDIGELPTLRFQRANLRRLLAILGRDRRWQCWLALSPDSALQSEIIATLPPNCRGIAQGTGDLGQRMGRIFRQLPPGPVVLVGSDIPEIGARHIAAAFSKLGDCDAVLGPAGDGGFWLVAMRRIRRFPGANVQGPFSPVRWSSEFALPDTMAAMRALNMRVGMGATLADIDNGRDYARWQARQIRQARRG